MQLRVSLSLGFHQQYGRYPATCVPAERYGAPINRHNNPKLSNLSLETLRTQPERAHTHFPQLLSLGAQPPTGRHALPDTGRDPGLLAPQRSRPRALSPPQPPSGRRLLPQPPQAAGRPRRAAHHGTDGGESPDRHQYVHPPAAAPRPAAGPSAAAAMLGRSRPTDSASRAGVAQPPNGAGRRRCAAQKGPGCAAHCGSSRSGAPRGPGALQARRARRARSGGALKGLFLAGY